MSGKAAIFAALRAPDFFLQVARRVALQAGRVRARDRVALIDGGGGSAGAVADKGWVVQADAGARACGIEAGMSAARALARHAGLIFLRREPGAEVRMSRRMLGFAEKFSPRFEATSPGVVTIDLSAAALPFSKEKLRCHATDLLRKARQWSSLEFLVIGMGDSPEGAMLAALRADPVCVLSGEREGGVLQEVGELPLGELFPDPEVAGVLSTWGIATAGQLVALPRDEVARRLGTGGVQLWDRAAGRGGRLLDLERGRKPYLRVEEIGFPMASLEPLLFLLRRILEELLAELAGDYLVAAGMRLVLGFADGGRRREEMRLPEACCDPELLQRVLHVRLDGVRAEAPVEKVALELIPCRPVGRQRGLFGSGIRDSNRLADTLAEIEGLLGAGAVGCPEPLNEHRPDAFVMRSFLPGGGSSDPGYGEEGSVLFRKRETARWGLPLRRLRPPEPLDVVEHRGAAGCCGFPVEIRNGRFRGRIADRAGPWLSSGGWWDEKPWRTEEWDVELGRGGLLRIARRENGKWQLEGVYG